MIGRRHERPLHESASRWPRVEICTAPVCPYCWRARRLLETKGVAFVEVDLWRYPERRAEMIERAGGRATVPQIFADDRALKGSDELAALKGRGELEALLVA